MTQTSQHRSSRPRRRWFAAAAAAGVATAALALAGCGTVTPSGAAAGGATETKPAANLPVSVTDCGRTVEVTAPPQRVVSLHPSITEMLIQLGVGDRVVAQAQDGLGTPTPELAAQVEAIPSLSSDTPPTKEVLIAEQPDLVLSGTEYEFNTEMGFAGYDELHALGIPAYVATAGCVDRRTAGTVDDAFTDLAFLGRVFGVPERAAELQAEARAELAAAEAVAGDAPPVRAAQVWVEAGKLYAVGGAVEVDILRRAGATNVFDDDKGLFSDFFAAEVNPEVVLEQDPEAFVFAVNDEKHDRDTRAYLRRTFPTSAAVRDDRLVSVDNTAIQPGTLAAVGGVRTVADGLHR